LRTALEKKLEISERHVNRLITQRSQALALPREQAAIAIALDSGVNVNRVATHDDLAAIRQARAFTASPLPATAASGAARPPEPPRAKRSRAIAAKRPRSARRTGQRRKVWVVYGRNEPARKALFAFLRSLGLSPVEFGSAIRTTRSASPYVGQILDRAFQSVQAVVVLLTGDDEARLMPAFRRRNDPRYEARLTSQARPNVLFEAGMAFGHHPTKTVIVQLGRVKSFSDIVGRHVIHLDNSAEKRTDLANRLASAGCPVDLAGTDWLSEGDFSG
jgi:predicted nucleotide-binding protein